MPGIEHDQTRWPLCVVHFVEQEEAELRSHVEKIDEYLAREQPFVLVFDVRRARMLNSLERGIYVDFIRSRAGQIRRLVPRCAVVATNPVHRGVLTAVKWMVDLPFETTFFRAYDDAIRWAEALLAEQAR